MHKIHDKFLSSNLVGNVLRFLVFISFMIVTFGQSEIFQHVTVLSHSLMYASTYIILCTIIIYIYLFIGVYI